MIRKNEKNNGMYIGKWWVNFVKLTKPYTRFHILPYLDIKYDYNAYLSFRNKVFTISFGWLSYELFTQTIVKVETPEYVKFWEKNTRRWYSIKTRIMDNYRQYRNNVAINVRYKDL